MSVAAIWCFSSDGPSASSEAAGRFSFLFQCAAWPPMHQEASAEYTLECSPYTYTVKNVLSMGVLNEGNIRFRKP